MTSFFGHGTISKQALRYFVAIDIVLISVAWWFFAGRPQSAPIGLEDFSMGGMQVSSPAFDQNGPIPQKYSCQGEAVHPPLVFSGVPATAKTLAIVVEDPDAPLGAFVHWTAWNLSARLTELPEGTLPGGAVEGKNGAGKNAYAGLCPPAGAHRYFFKVYALDQLVTLPPEVDAARLLAEMQTHVVARAALMGTYRKQ